MQKTKVRSATKKKKNSWEDVLQDFLLWKKAQGLAESTLSEYSRHICYFFNHYPDAFSSFEQYASHNHHSKGLPEGNPVGFR